MEQQTDHKGSKGILPPTVGLSPLRLAVLCRASVSNLKIPKITPESVQKALKGDQDTGTSQAHFQRKGWSREMRTLHAEIDYIPIWERACSTDKQRENSSPAVFNKCTKLLRQMDYEVTQSK